MGASEFFNIKGRSWFTNCRIHTTGSDIPTIPDFILAFDSSRVSRLTPKTIDDSLVVGALTKMGSLALAVSDDSSKSKSKFDFSEAHISNLTSLWDVFYGHDFYSNRR